MPYRTMPSSLPSLCVYFRDLSQTRFDSEAFAARAGDRSEQAGPPRWPSGKASASRAEGPGFESRLRRDFFGVESYR